LITVTLTLTLALEVSGLWATNSESVGKIVQLVSKISNLCDHNPPALQTDDMRSQYRNISASRRTESPV